jgi:hypothetical protein
MWLTLFPHSLTVSANLLVLVTAFIVADYATSPFDRQRIKQDNHAQADSVLQIGFPFLGALGLKAKGSDWFVADWNESDFVSAGAFPGNRYVDIPRETAYRLGLKIIRGAAGGACLLLIGLLILPALGMCESSLYRGRCKNFVGLALLQISALQSD